LNAPNCVVNEYNFKSKTLGLATARINGRYPDSGKALNTECDQIYYVISGSGTIHHEAGSFEVEQGDAFFFEKGKWYWIEGKELFVALPSAPTWFFDQYKELD